jgi:iron uptake system component EfeO
MRNGMGTTSAACALATALGLLAAGCGSDGGGGSQEDQVARAMQQSLTVRLTTLRDAATALQMAAPTPAGRGWDKNLDAAAFTAMKTAWISARDAYEHVEGATAPIFGDLDVSLDERYDGFLAKLGPAGDPDPFDGAGVTGMHAIERILYADVVPMSVVTFEMSLPGYAPAAWPATEADAAQFKSGLAGKLVTDAQALLEGWTQQKDKVDISGSFTGLVGLMNEQQEKVNNAANGEEESRYSQRTMADLRSNLDGTTAIYALFRGWLESKPATATMFAGSDIDAAITAGFGKLDTLYTAVPGEAIPQPPATWSAENPSAADLQTPFGQLYQGIHQAVDPKTDGSLVVEMNDGATLLGIPVFTE